MWQQSLEVGGGRGRRSVGEKAGRGEEDQEQEEREQKKEEEEEEEEEN